MYAFAGMNFLSSAPDVMNAMARALTQTVDEMPLTAMLPITVGHGRGKGREGEGGREEGGRGRERRDVCIH